MIWRRTSASVIWSANLELRGVEGMVGKKYYDNMRGEWQKIPGSNFGDLNSMQSFASDKMRLSLSS